jgi:hypothetical protein
MPAMVEPLWDVYASFARKFNLGKQGEAALDRLSEAAKKPLPSPAGDAPPSGGSPEQSGTAFGTLPTPTAH